MEEEIIIDDVMFLQTFGSPATEIEEGNRVVDFYIEGLLRKSNNLNTTKIFFEQSEEVRNKMTKYFENYLNIEGLERKKAKVKIKVWIEYE